MRTLQGLGGGQGQVSLAIFKVWVSELATLGQ